MEFTIDEIINNTSGYIFFKGKNFDKNKKYRISMYEQYMDPVDNSCVIYMPLKLTINDILWDNFEDIELYLKTKNLKAFVFDEQHFIEEEWKEKLLSLIEKYKDTIEVVVMVDRNTRTLIDVANYAKNFKMDKRTKYIAVTGTVAKTSTTELLWSVLSTCRKSFRGSKEVNLKSRTNHKFFEVNPDIDYFLLELSGASPGYLKQFSELLIPDGAIITKVSKENINTYGTLDIIAIEKLSLLCAMPETSVAVINDTPLLKEYSKNYNCKKIFVKEGSYELIELGKNGSSFKYKGEEYYIPVVGLHQIDNACRVIELLKQFDFSYEEIYNGFKQFKSFNYRWVVDEFPDDVIFVTDCPNNPSFDTLMASIDTFMKLYGDYDYKRIIISDITSLGGKQDDILLEVAERLSKLDIQELVLISNQMKLVRDYVLKNSDINVIWFDTPNKINKNAEYIKYLSRNMCFKQANLIKGKYEEYICYGETADYLKELLCK